MEVSDERNLKRSVKDENDDQIRKKLKHEDNKTSLDIGKPVIDFKKKKKCVLLLSYCGSGYSGMQRNPGVQTIEEDLTNALLKANAITEDASRNYGKMSFQRCARTDKGVSAARQVVSLKMIPSKELLQEINEHLKPQIRVFALKKVTRGFDCKNKCSSRTYEYLMPTLAFSQSFARTASNFRITDEIRREISDVLLMYKGTHNFHNFTSGRGFKDESSKRYMMELKISGEPFVEKDMEFVVLQVQGQSFMQHQIRKMIGLLIAIIRNCTGIDAIERSFNEPKMDIPKAPGLGLILDQVHFEDYNKKFGRDKIHEPLMWQDCEDKIVKFKKEFIYSDIIETEVKTKSMLRWLNSLSSHSYCSTGMYVKMSDKKSVDEPIEKHESSCELLPQEEKENEMEEINESMEDEEIKEGKVGEEEIKEGEETENMEKKQEMNEQEEMKEM